MDCQTDEHQQELPRPAGPSDPAPRPAVDCRPCQRLRLNGNLIPKTLQENGVKMPPFTWKVQDFQDLNQYMVGVISRAR